MTSTDNPRVLVVTRNLPPLVGGMERLLANTIRCLSDEWRVGVIGPIGCGAHLQSIDFLREVPAKPLWRFLPACMAMSAIAGGTFKPQLVLSGSGLTVPAARLAGWVAGAPVVTWVHGLDIVADNRLYQTFFVRSIRDCRAVIVNSRHTADLALRAAVPAERIHIIHPGVTVGAPAVVGGGDFRARHHLGEGPLLLSVGRLTRRKGLVPFIRQCLPRLVRAIPALILVVIGDDAKAAVERSRMEGRDAILAASLDSGVSAHVRMLGNVGDAELTAAYRAANLLVFPVVEQSGDVEGFGMVAAEAAAHGLPTVAFRVGGVGDAVQDRSSGWLLEPGDYTGMAERIESWILDGDGAGVSRDACLAHAEALSWPRFGAALRRVLCGVRRLDE